MNICLTAMESAKVENSFVREVVGIDVAVPVCIRAKRVELPQCGPTFQGGGHLKLIFEIVVGDMEKRLAIESKRVRPLRELRDFFHKPRVDLSDAPRPGILARSGHSGHEGEAGNENVGKHRRELVKSQCFFFSVKKLFCTLSSTLRCRDL